MMIHAIGKRKTSVARAVATVNGTGLQITVNNKSYGDYVRNNVLIRDMMTPLVVTGGNHRLKINIWVSGGGANGQVGAIRLAISKLLLKMDKGYRMGLKEHNLLTRDPRMVERKKFGKKKSRKSSQFSKR